MGASVAAGASAQAASDASRAAAAPAATGQPLVHVGMPTLVKIGGGDHDAFLDPGEIATISVPATNDGDFKATGVQVTLSSPDPNVTVSTPTQNYKSIKVGQTKAKKFKILLSGSYQTDKPVALVAQADFIGVNSPTTANVFVPTGEPSGTATTFSYTGPAVAIPDEDSTGVAVPLAVSGVGYASKLTFSIDGDTCSTAVGATTVGLDHSWVGDLVATLTSPAGDQVTLFSRPGGALNSGNNLCQAVLDDGATTALAAALTSDAPFTGTWRPDQPLSSLLGSAVDGTWTLTVSDLAFLDTGSVRAFSLNLYGFLS